MSFVLIGGHDRMYREYIQIGREQGHKIKVFTQLPARFAKSIGLPDAILIFTSTISHKMMFIAEREAKRKQIPVVKSHCSSGAALKRSIEEIEIMLEA
jgi:hypothetical protein